MSDATPQNPTAPASPATPQDSQQRLHDLRAVYSNFKAVTHLLRSGYRFDDDQAPAALNQLDKAVVTLEREIRCLELDWTSASKEP